ncbi:hypothetical protein O0544_18900 [Edwardsiella anguillarum]|nr:hypothetical protein [Edwardsiella anguillarum]
MAGYFAYFHGTWRFYYILVMAFEQPFSWRIFLALLHYRTIGGMDIIAGSSLVVLSRY